MDASQIAAFKLLYDESDVPIICTDLKSKIVYFNQKGGETLEIYQLSKRNFYYEPTQLSWGHYLNKSKMKISLKKLNHEPIHLTVTSQFLKHINVIVIFFENMDEEKFDGSSIEQSYENLMRVFNQIDYPIIISNRIGEILGFNYAINNIVSNDFITAPQYDLFISSFQIDNKSLLEFYKEIAAKNFGEMFVKKENDHEVKYYRVLAFYYAEKNFLITVIRDHNAKLENPINEPNDMALKLLGVNTAKILHEISNPLSILKGYIKLLKKSSNDKFNHYNVMDEELSKIMRLTSELLYISNPKKDAYQNICIVEVIQECLLLYELQSTSQYCRIEFIYNDLTEYKIYGNSERLKQVIINLLKNAREAIHPQKECIVKIYLNKIGNACRIIIRDNGPGIDEKNLKRLFVPFYTTKTHGTGLGLCITKQLIEEHSGVIKVDSIIGKGTQFAIELPIVKNVKKRDLIIKMHD